MTAKGMRCKQKKSEDGLTLVETLIALAIFSIGILGIAQLQMWNMKNNTTGNITTEATMMARAKLEELKNSSDVTSLSDGADTVGIYTRKWEITNPLAGAFSRQIQVEVSWNRQGQNREVVLTTISSGNGT